MKDFAFMLACGIALGCLFGSFCLKGKIIMDKLDQIMNGSIREINAYFRANDESHLWPICNKFDATERAIRRLRKLQMYNGGLEYFYALDAEISSIVNATV